MKKLKSVEWIVPDDEDCSKCDCLVQYVDGEEEMIPWDDFPAIARIKRLLSMETKRR